MSGRVDIPAFPQRRHGAFADAIARLRGGPKRPVVVSARPPTIGRGELCERRDRLARQLAELPWDLGGLTYEMAIRDHFRVDVLVRVAARMQTVRVERAEIERLLDLDEAAA